MSQLRIAIIGPSQDSCRHVRIAVQASAPAGEIFATTLPLTGAVCAELARSAPDVVLIEVPGTEPKIALDTMAAIHDLVPKAKIIAIGEVKDAATVVGAMRAGACDFVETPLQTADLQRLLATGSDRKQSRGKVFSFVNAKGGSGSTTLAVNLGLVLASISRRVALVDLAVPGNAALHLNLTPSFTIREAIGNLHRLDALLLEGMMMNHGSGLRLLAGATEPQEPIPAEQLAALLDVITAQNDFVVVDVSTRLDGIARSMCEFSDLVLLVAQPDVPSMWNAQRVQRYLCNTVNTDKVKLVLNRYRKTPGVSESEFEKASGCELMFTVPNQYVTVAKSITNGVPVALQSSSELKPAFLNLARLLTGASEEVEPAVQQARGKSLLERVASLRSFGAMGGAKASLNAG